MDRSRVSDQVAHMAEAERELLQAKLRDKTLASGAQWSIPRRSTRDAAPLSFAQQRLWFLDQLEPGSPLYNVFRAVRLNGRLDVGALEKALQAIVARHQILRATIRAAVGIPAQVVNETSLEGLAVIDLSDCPDSQRDAEMARVLRAETTRPFNLSRDLMLRATLLRLGNQNHVLLLTIHHIAADGWSLGVLFRELSALYEGFSTGNPATLPELPIQYADYAIWQRKWLQGEALESQLSYWKRQLNDLSALQLPTDRPRPATQSYRGARQSLVLSEDLSAKLKAFSRKERVTLFMLLLAAFQALLHRYSGQDDIAVGSPIAGRTRREMEGLIGFFVNTLVLRTDLSGNPTFKELLARVRETALGAYAHQDVPFEKLVEELQPERDPSRSPLFQVMFGLQNFPAAPAKLAGLTVTPMKLDWETAKFDLSLSMHDEAPGLRASLEYSTDLFDAATITRMLGHFQVLLEAIIANPERRLSDLPMLTEAEKHRLLVEWNDTEKDYPKDKGIHQLFEAQAERTPDATAAIFENERLTYRELNRRANQLAHHLRKLGVGPDALVGICMERSLEMVVGLLGVLKAGGAYVPLDPEYPKERLAFMLEDSRAPVLLTQTRLVENLSGCGAQVVCLDPDWQAIVGESDENPAATASAENVAYVIYTSGSTGQPKGVMIPHSAICNHMFWMQDQFPLSGEDRVVQKTPFSFDASVGEFFAPLISGVPLVMARPGGHRDAAYLTGLISQEKVTVFQLVPSLLQMILEEEEVGGCRCLRRVFCGGEALSIELRDRVANRLGVDLHNLYGPTEATIDATFWTCGSDADRRNVPIGRPVSNTEIYLLDANWNPVPAGIAGEIYLGGKGLARGYWNRPGLTAEKFLPNPFSAEPGSRLYRTGDLARYRADGAVEFLGRIDHQVKMRGFRIELGEIESVLSEHPAVVKSLVLIREDTPGDQRLVAYIVAGGRQADESELRSLVKKRLPEYMAPSAFVTIDAFPLTPNGKIDRRALPAPGSDRTDLQRTYVAPRTLVEESVAAIWGEVLALDRVGIHDNFFELGGHSLKATQVISRVNKKFQIQLPLRNLFETPTVAGLAESVQAIGYSGRQWRLDTDTTAAREQGEI